MIIQWISLKRKFVGTAAEPLQEARPNLPSAFVNLHVVGGILHVPARLTVAVGRGRASSAESPNRAGVLQIAEIGTGSLIAKTLLTISQTLEMAKKKVKNIKKQQEDKAFKWLN